MKVELLYFEGCPNHKPALDRVRTVLRQERVSNAEVTETEIADQAAAERLQFLGSPSIRVNGVDIEPAARSARNFGLLCRTYGDGCCHGGIPSQELIRSALQEFVAG